MQRSNNKRAAGARLGVVGFALMALLFTRLSFASNASAPLILETLSTRDGLPQGTVMATLQDSQGFVWLGTEDGLVRFDGHEINRYAYSPTSTGGLPGNFINAIAEDKSGDLWIGIKGNGLAKWHRRTDTFTVYQHSASNPNTLGSDIVRSISIDRAGLIWIGTLDSGLDLLDPRTQRFQHFHHDDQDEGSLSDDQVQTLYQDRAGDLWVGTHRGLDRWDSKARRFWHFALRQRSPAGADQISQIIEDTTGALWVGTFDDGLYRIERSGEIKEHFRHDAEQATSLSNNDVRAVLDDHAGHLWIGTADGLNLLDRDAKEFTHYKHDKTDPDSLVDSFVMSLYRDPTGLVWIGTRAAGVSRWNPHSWELGGSRPDWLDGKLVTSFADATDHKVWIGSLGGGLAQLDVATGKAVDIDTLLHAHNALPDQRVMSLLQDRHGTLWIGTMASGLQKLSNGKVTSIPVQAGDAHSLSAAGIMSIYESRSGQIWIGTHGGGANVLDPETGLVRQLPLASSNVTSFAEDREGNFWIGTDGGGLSLVHPDGTVVRVFRHDLKDHTSLAANTIYSLAMDADGTIWIATDGGGLDQVVGSSINPESIRFKNFSHVNGLSGDTLYGVVPDAAGHLWLSGNAGLMRFSPASGIVKTFHRENGLQGEEFNSGAYLRTKEGLLCFGGPGGFNVFDPLKLAENRTPPRVVLTRLEILGVPLRGQVPNWLTQRVLLNYQANIVSLDFAALDFSSLNRNELAYRMAGLTDSWISLGTLRRVTLTNLEPGEHVLEVRAVNGDSIASAKPFRLAIHKDPVPWRSTPAYALYAAIAVILIWLGIRAQRRKLNSALAAQYRLESEVELRTQELREANRELIVASEAKSSFLARMGHELRTPMNGVVGMAELLARSPLSTPQARQTRTILSSAQTLLKILNDLLDLSKAQAGKVQLESAPVDLLQIIEECSALFHAAAESKNVELVVCPPEQESVSLLGDSLRIRQVLLNLIGNAVKFTERGEVVIRCAVTTSDSAEASVDFTITDTGIGISDTALVKIFEPFAQADETTTRRFGGTGLGLAIVSELVELMGGSIDVQSTPGAGSRFAVALRLKTDAPADGTGSADCGSRAREFAGAQAHIIARREALRESVTAYLRLLGVKHSGSGVGSQFVVIDADSCPDALQTLARTGSGEREKLIVAASARTIETLKIESLVPAGRLLRKPITLAALGDALHSVANAVDEVDAQSVIRLPEVEGIGAHVLIVEDEATNAAVAQGYLEELGCTSVWVDNGAAAVARSTVERFDIVLMDLNMPALDGYATTALIRKVERPGSHLTIVALTANDAASYRESCLLAGMDDILSKPYTLSQLTDVLRRSGAGKGATQPHQLSLVDRSTVQGLRKIKSRGSADLYPKLVTLFESSSTQCLVDLRAAVDSNDLRSAAGTCHKLKSSAANVGALQFAGALAELERLCHAGDTQAARTQLERLRAAHPGLLEELRLLTVRASA